MSSAPKSPSNLLYLARCESTQDELWSRWDQEGPHAPEALYTLDQRAGRGRLGRAWVAPAEACLCLSWRVPVGELSADELWALSFVGGLAVAQLTRALGAPCALKWPNDLLWCGRKLAGVLCEARVEGGSSAQPSSPRVVIGVGFNLKPDPRAFTGAVSLAERLAEAALPPPEPAQLACDLLRALKLAYTLLRSKGSGALLAEWRRDSLPAGTLIKAGGRQGRLREVSDTGSLLLDTSQGLMRIDSGEVELISPRDKEGVQI